MAMERTEYPAMLATLQPGQAVDVLNDRVRQVGKLNTEIADWLQERRRLEELYSNGLRKLARKQINGADLGVFSAPWTTLQNSAENLADSHSALAGKIEVDVERPLREFAGGNREMQNMTNMQGNLKALAKDVDSAQQKTEKLQGKGGQNKIANASSDLETAQAQWESQAPYVFENLQAVDEARWNHLRDVLTQFQTHEVDQVEKHRVAAEGVLNVLLNVETVDEIKTFALRTVENKPTLQRNRPSTAASGMVASASTPSRGADYGAPPAPSLQPPDDDARSASVPEEKKKKFGGLRRLGTVMRNKRESKMPQQLQPMSESPERPAAKSSPFNSFSGRLGRSKETPTLAAPPESEEQRRPRSPLRMGSEVLEAPQRPSQEPSSPSPVAERQTPSTNGYGMAAGGAAVGAAAAGGAAYAANIPNGSHQGDLADLEPPKPSEPEPTPRSSAAEPIRDNEGYSVPPSQIDAITQAQQDAEASGENMPPQFNVNIRNAPIEEERSADADAALASMASKLQMQAPALNSRRLGTVRGRREARNSFIPPGAQGVAESSPSPGASEPAMASSSPPPFESIAVDREMPPPEAQPATSPFAFSSPAASPNQASAATFSPFPTNEPTSPFNRPASRTAALTSDHTGDNHSIRSGRSLASTTSQSHRHPDLAAPGLNASIIETLSARFEKNELASSSLTGEIALVHNPSSASSATSEILRLDNFASLDKVAPNPAFIAPLPEKQGEYAVQLPIISGKTQIAFKYQVRLDAEGPNASQPPLLVSPLFRIEPTQASVIISYSLNPAFALPAGMSSLTLSNVVLALTLEGAKATSCQSKPVGTFSKEKNLIFWQLGNVTLSSGAAPTKLLARFVTEGEAASGGAVEGRWEIIGEESKGVGSGLGVSVASSVDSSDPFADEDSAGWKAVEGSKKVVAGSYVARGS